VEKEKKKDGERREREQEEVLQSPSSPPATSPLFASISSLFFPTFST
jgi:hypothetical protein